MESLRVFVTGGGRGIGRAIALRFARAQARVVVAARTSAEIDRVAQEVDALGGKGLASQVDVRDHGSVEAAIFRAVQFTDGAIDVLVNNAGDFDLRPFAETDRAFWAKTVEVNLTGAYYVTHEAIDPLMESTRPHVFNIASIAARQGFPHATAYCASKYGLRGFSDALRAEWAGKNVRVSTVYPGPTDTDMLRRVKGDWDPQRLNSPDDVAEVVWKAYHAADGADVNDLDVPPRVAQEAVS